MTNLPSFHLRRRCIQISNIFVIILIVLTQLSRSSPYHAQSNCGNGDLPHVVEPRTSGDLLYRAHPFKSKKKRLTAQEKALFKPLRIHYDTTHLDGVLSAARKSFVEINLLKRAADRLAEVLRVIPVQGNLRLSPRCRSFWDDESHQCANYDIPMQCGEIVQVPTEHLNPEKECSLRPDECKMTEGGAGIPNADVVVYVTAYQYAACASSSTLAFAASCARDDIMDRPIAGYINLCPGQLETVDPNSVESVQKWEYITIHEIVHVLGVSSSHFPFFRDKMGNPRTERDKFGYPPIENGFFVSNENTVKLVTRPDGTRSNEIVTETAVQFARDHFGCPTLEGVALEDAGGVGSAGSHVEAKHYLGDFMNAAIPQFPVVSAISLAILEDSNWYLVDFSKADAFVWGSDQGCDFINKPCLVKKSHDPPEAPFPEHFCNIPNDMGCTHDLKGKGMCSIGRFSANIEPAGNRYFTDSLQGGNRMTNYCPFYSLYNQIGAGISSCIGTTAKPEDSTNPRGETYSSSSRCIVNTLNKEGSAISQRGGCYNVDCRYYPLRVSLSVGDQVVSCDRDEEGESKTVPGYKGVVLCPDVDRICASITPDPCQAVVCPSNAKCVEGACKCLPQWNGNQCDVTTCFGEHSNMTSRACSGRGTCIAPDICSCDSGYTGDKCETLSCFYIPQQDVSVCSSHGVCTGPNQCACDTNYYGDECAKPICFGVQSDDAEVCSGRGSCTGPDLCTCFDGYQGEKCEKFKCIDGASGSIVTCEGESACSHIASAATDCVCQGSPGEDICLNTLNLLAKGSKKTIRVHLFVSGQKHDEISCDLLLDENSMKKLGIAPRCEWNDPTEVVIHLGTDATINEWDIIRVNMNPFHSEASYYDVKVHYNATVEDAVKDPAVGYEESGGSDTWWVVLSIGGVSLTLLICLSCIAGVVLYLFITRFVRGSKKAPRRKLEELQGPTPMTPPVTKETYTSKQKIRRGNAPLDDGEIYITEKETTRWQK
mmetsp:Transcript_14/g.59  ORF Transcript_14/g.59 Transcript_14/m.59 type:complete len:996 (-) Transcript_14:177-3164(-)